MFAISNVMSTLLPLIEANALCFTEAEAAIAINAIATGENAEAIEANTALIAAMGFVDRGDLAVIDWDEGSFTRDGAFHDFDMSSKIPAGATWGYIEIAAQCTSSIGTVIFKKQGWTGTHNVFVCQPVVTGRYYYSFGWLQLTPARLVQYLIQPNVTNIIVNVKGWVVG